MTLHQALGMNPPNIELATSLTNPMNKNAKSIPMETTIIVSVDRNVNYTLWAITKILTAVNETKMTSLFRLVILQEQENIVNHYGAYFAIQ